MKNWYKIKAQVTTPLNTCASGVILPFREFISPSDSTGEVISIPNDIACHYDTSGNCNVFATYPNQMMSFPNDIFEMTLIYKNKCGIDTLIAYFTINNGCKTDGTEFQEETNELLNQDEDNKQSLNNIKIYPNPTNDMINIISSENIKSATIYNLIGQEVYNQQNVESNKLNINLISYTNGIYFIKINDNIPVKIVKK